MSGPHGDTNLIEHLQERARAVEHRHECGRDLDPYCGGCVTAMSDAFGSNRDRWPS